MTDAATFLKSTRGVTGAALPLSLAAGALRGVMVVAVAWVLAGVVDAVVFRGADLAAVARPLAILVVLMGARAALAWIADQTGFAAAARVRTAIFHRLLDHVRALGPVRLVGVPTGEIVAVLTDAVAAIEPYWRRWIPATATAVVVPFAILAAVAPLDWWTTLVFALTLPLVVVFLILVGQGAEAMNRRQWATLTRLAGHLLDAVQGLADLKLFRASKREIAVVVAMAEAYRRDTMAVLRVAFLSALVLEFFATISIAVTAVLVGFRLLWGEIDFHTGFFVLLLAPEFYAPVRNLGVERHARMEAVAAAERLVAFLDRPASSRPPGKLRPTFGPALSLRLDGIRVVHGDGPPALDGIDLTIAAGEHVALVGPTGAGKSTLFALLLGFLEPTAGRVLIDDVPLAEVDLDDWRSHIAHVPQAPRLFDGDIVDNVAMGREPSVGDVETAVRAALAAAEMTEVVARLPQGLRTRLDEASGGLSGGEAQRLALARAFYRPAPLVLFDEPTAHLDPATERAIGAAVATASTGRTTITIAHRLDTVRRADRIVVLDAGRIVEQGSHDALIAAGGLYARLVAATADRADDGEGEGA